MFLLLHCFLAAVDGCGVGSHECIRGRFQRRLACCPFLLARIQTDRGYSADGSKYIRVHLNMDGINIPDSSRANVEFKYVVAGFSPRSMCVQTHILRLNRTRAKARDYILGSMKSCIERKNTKPRERVLPGLARQSIAKGS
jgi:hypothetical protein